MKKKMIYLMIISILLVLPNAIFAFVSGLEPNPSSPGDGINSMVGVILGVIQWIGYAIALGMLIYIGVKYTMSAANERADLKRSSINFIIGAIIIAGAATICGWIVTFFQDADNANGGGTGGGGTGGSYYWPSGSMSGTTQGNIWGGTGGTGGTTQGDTGGGTGGTIK